MNTTEKIKLIINWLKNTKLIFSFRKYFFYYLYRIVGLNSLPLDKKYLKNFPDFIGGYCATNFISYAPVYMEPHIKALARQIFNDESSRELYRAVFLRNMYSAHLISGWEKYYDSEAEFTSRLNKIKSEIKDDPDFVGNAFIVKGKKEDKYEIHYKNGLNYALPINWFELSVFSFKLGLVFVENKYLNYIKNTYLIDVGAFVGDSSIVLAEYTDKKVLAIEPEGNNFKLLKQTIELNNLSNKIEIFNNALDKESKKVGIYNSGPGSIIEEQSKDNSGITTITLDNLVGDRYQKVGLIKMDVEGYEMNILLGSENIIKRDKPVLLISIYHNGDQFINIPLYLQEKYSDIYSFKFIDCNPVHPLSEKVLLCLPKNV